MAYGAFRNLLRRISSDKVLLDKVFNVPKNRKCDGYQYGLVSMVYRRFDKKSAMSADKSAATHAETGLNSNTDSENRFI